MCVRIRVGGKRAVKYFFNKKPKNQPVIWEKRDKLLIFEALKTNGEGKSWGRVR